MCGIVDESCVVKRRWTMTGLNVDCEEAEEEVEEIICVLVMKTAW